MDKKYKKLTPEEEKIIIRKGTEAPFSGKYYKHKEKGVYVCKRCGAQLYKSSDKFDSDCGWPSFDDEVPGAIKRVPDKNGKRTEIICNNCGAHLGHVFTGEHMTKKNVRHCVNSLSLDFKKQDSKDELETAYFAGGCFWGLEYYFQRIKGVVSTRVGYMGGKTSNPAYEQVSSGKTGHAETLEVVFDTSKLDFEKLARLFFEIHDPTQVNRQGPDIGEQYRSVIFYVNDKQKLISEKLIGLLEKKGYKVATDLIKADVFWPAEEHHQKYYLKKGGKPYCHIKQQRF